MHFKNNFMEIANDITSLVGNTPLVKLNRIRKYFDCYPEIIAKLESFNPSASVKDRIAYSMLCKAEEEGFCLLYTSPSPRDRTRSRMPSSA